jgi:hypothetical protein
MAAANDMLDGLNEIHGAKKPEDMGLGEWIWTALQGDFNTERSAGQIGFDMVVSLVPGVDTVCDLRDLCANIRQYRKEPGNKITLFFIATTVVGFIPEIGTVVKSALRLMWIFLKPLIKHADDILNVGKLVAATNRACDAALPKITEYLQHNRVAKWATDGKLPDIYQFVGKTIRDAADKLNPALLSRLLKEKFDDLKNLLQKVRLIVPSTIREHIDDLLKSIDSTRHVLSSAIQNFAQPIRTVLKVFAKKLDDQAWRAEIRRTNRGWIAPISESGSARLINAKPPKWAKQLPLEMRFPPLKMNINKVDLLMREHPEHPRIANWIVETFSKKGKSMQAGHIKGPAKLFRVIDPSNEGAGIFWMTEAEFKKIKNRDEWRSKFAVKPEWNQNGWVVEYEIRAGETLPVWRGPAAGQKLEGTNYHLEGGGEQIVFFPSSRDEMVQAMPRANRETGAPIMDRGQIDQRVEYTDVTGNVAPTKLRARITDPRIRGPIETGWGATDYTEQEARRILLTAPTST